MKKLNPAALPEGHLARYDWTKARRGRLVEKAAKVSELLRILEPDLAARFPDSRAVNDALRRRSSHGLRDPERHRRLPC